jgi:hypothetical protein
MARRKSPKRRRTRKRTGVKLIPLAASYISVSAVTNTLFNNNAWNFFTYDWMGTGRGPGGGLGQGYDNFTLAEIVKTYSGQNKMSTMIRSGGTFGQEIMSNFQKNWATGTMQLIAGAALPKIMNRIPGRPVQKVNKLLKDIGVGDVVKL